MSYSKVLHFLAYPLCVSVDVRVCYTNIFCYQELTYSQNIYWGQTGTGSGIQTAEHMYTELFSLAQTNFANPVPTPKYNVANDF